MLRQPQAEGILAIRKAEAEGFRLIGEALAKCPDKELVVKLAGLVALQDGDVFSLVAGWKETLDSVAKNQGASPSDAPPPVASKNR